MPRSLLDFAQCHQLGYTFLFEVELTGDKERSLFLWSKFLGERSLFKDGYYDENKYCIVRVFVRSRELKFSDLHLRGLSIIFKFIDSDESKLTVVFPPSISNIILLFFKSDSRN